MHEQSTDLVTVVVPVYNVEKYLDRCLDSLVRQNYQHLEIVLVNDGSTDSSGDICDGYAAQDRRFRVMHQPNAGLSAARNVGIDTAAGNLITFIDSDDYVTVDYVSSLFVDMQETDSDIACVGYTRVSESTPVRTRPVNDVQRERRVLSTDAALADLFNQRGVTTSAWGKLYKRNLFRDIRYPVGAHHEDLPVTYRLFGLSRRVSVSTARCYMYLEREGSITVAGGAPRRLVALEFANQALREMRGRAPEVSAAAQTRLFTEAIYIVCTADGKDAEERRASEAAWEAVIANRWHALRSQGVRPEVRAFAVASALGPSALRVTYRARAQASRMAWKLLRAKG